MLDRCILGAQMMRIPDAVHVCVYLHSAKRVDLCVLNGCNAEVSQDACCLHSDARLAHGALKALGNVVRGQQHLVFPRKTLNARPIARCVESV